MVSDNKNQIKCHPVCLVFSLHGIVTLASDSPRERTFRRARDIESLPHSRPPRVAGQKYLRGEQYPTNDIMYKAHLNLTMGWLT